MFRVLLQVVKHVHTDPEPMHCSNLWETGFAMTAARCSSNDDGQHLAPGPKYCNTLLHSCRLHYGFKV